MNLAKSVLLAVALVCSMPVAAQWAWRDATGKMVYSDQPPPKSVPSRDIVRQPGPAPRRSAAPEAEADSATAAKAPAAPTVTEREIESRRRQQELAEAEKKAADDESRKAMVAENCERLRGYLRALEGGQRVARINAAGQQEVLDDAVRGTETERTRAQIEQFCQ